MGMIVTHFSLGSFFPRHGCETSPFRTRLLWKYFCGIPRMPEAEPKEEAGRDPKGEANGLPLGAAEMLSLKGSVVL